MTEHLALVCDACAETYAPELFAAQREALAYMDLLDRSHALPHDAPCDAELPF